MPDDLAVRPWYQGLLDLLRSWFDGPAPLAIDDHGEPRGKTTAALPGLEPPRGLAPPDRPAEHVRLCIDFGTSCSAVARAVHGAEPELAVLQVDPRSGKRYSTIDSDIAWAAAEPAILGATARLIEERSGRGSGSREYHRSLKRMLSDLRRDEQSHVRLRLRVEALIEELLALALDPERSGTVRKQAELLGVPVASLAKDLGLPNHANLRPTIGRGTLDLYLCVPNAFGNFEEEVLRSAAFHAGQAFQRALAPAPEPWAQETTAPPAVVVHLIREAEAVAWWVLHRKALRGRDSRAIRGTWMVFDIGAGSTDAAVVEVATSESPAEPPSVRTSAHTGVAFGGHDIDEMFLRLTAERAGASIPEGLDQRIRTAGTTRAIELRTFSDAKEAWSRGLHDGLTRGDPGLMSAWLEWIEKPSGVMPGSDVLAPFRPNADLWPEARELAGPAWGEDYARFLRGAVQGVLRALDAVEPGVSLDRVILSGRGCLLPGVAAAVTHRLLQSGRIRSADQVAFVDADLGGDPDRLKLACVLGIAVAASHAAIPAELPQTLAEEVCVGRNIPLWPRGVRLHETTARASLRLEGQQGSRRVGFYQYRCPREVAEAVDAPSLWEQRHLGVAELHVFEPVELHGVFDVRTGQLRVWRGAAGTDVVPLRLEIDPVFATGTNPVSRLPFGWVDA